MPKYATFEEKVAAGFEEASDRMSEIDGRVSETAEAVKEAMNAIRRFTTAFKTQTTSNGQPYQSFWPTEEHAKDFARLFMVAAGKMSPSKLSDKTKGMTEGVGSAGGVLVPDEMRAILIDLMPKYGRFRANALRFPLGGGVTNVPKISSDVTIYCPGEGVTTTDSKPAFSNVKLTPKTFVALVAVSMELEEDSLIGVGEILGRSFVRSMAKQEDLIGFLGDGTATYFGMTGIIGQFLKISETIGNIAGLQVGTGNAYSELVVGDFEALVAKLPEDFDENAKWYCSKKFYYMVMYRIAVATGVANMVEILSNRKEKFFMGYEVVFTPAMPSAEANSQICCLLGDLSMGAYLGERREMRIDRSDQRYFEMGQVGFRASERIDINVFGCGDTTNPGPIVGLITAAS
jgi:HK97 family phage major capsid protein